MLRHYKPLQGGGAVGGFSRLKAQRAEAFAIVAGAAQRNPLAHEAGCDGSEKNATAKMPGGQEQPLHIGRTEDRQVIGRIWTGTCPGFFDGGAGQRGSEFDSSGE